MFSVRVMPVAKGIFKDHLTFFSKDALPPGTVVEAKIRNRAVSGIVLSSRDVREEKMDIRNAEFALKKIDPEGAKRIFLPAFMEAVRESALWAGVHEGLVAETLTSHAVLSSLKRLAETPKTPEKSAEVVSELLVLQAEYAERVRTYRNLAREAFARGASVIILAPTVIEAETLSEELSRGVEEQVVLMTSELTKTKLVASWNRIVEEKRPLLIIGTAFVLSCPRADVDTVIVERESAKSYRTLRRPFLDVRRAAEYFARASNARMILADFPLRAETRYRTREHEAEELSRLQQRLSGNASVSITDSRPKDEVRGAKRVFTTLAPETKAEIAAEIKKGGRVAVFAARKGLAPLTVCNDCGTPVTDPSSGMPMVLHKTPKGNMFISHKSGAVLPAETACRVCGGWNLVTLGIGVDRVHDELSREFDGAPIFLFTKESAPNHKAAKKLSKEFYEEKGAIIVGTERMLPYLTGHVDIAAVASIDAMLSLPAWRANEQALSILFYLKERAESRLIIETREPGHEVMKTVAAGNPSDFYRTEIDEREKYGYPPFSVFIGLTSVGSLADIAKAETVIKETFKDTDLVGPLPAEAMPKNAWRSRAAIRLPARAWPDPALSEKLKSLPPNVLVAIDPDEIV